MELHVDFIKLLGKADICEDDYTCAEQKIEKFIFYVFGKNTTFVLKRIDYRYDVVLDESDRRALIKIYKKSHDVFKQKRKDSKYRTTIYFSSKAFEICIYDKEKERKKKNMEVKEYEKDVLRYEIRLKNRHLNYMKNKHGVLKDLKNYFSIESFKRYIIKDLLKFIFIGDYCKIYIVDKIIKNSNLKTKDKELVREFLIDISKYGITKTKKLQCNKKIKYSKYKFKKALKILQMLNINPLLIPKNEKNKSSIIENPFKFIYE